jgi:23S rRNA (uracil1939-C5)-methyltransferase
MKRKHISTTIENVEVTGMSSEGKGIAKIDGKVHFVKGAVPGDVVNLQTLKSKSKYAECSLGDVLMPSKDRVEPVCDYFGVCGGCKWQQVDYTAQLRFKQEIVSDAFERIGKVEVRERLPIVGSDNQYFYRNKMEYGFTDRRWLTIEEINSGMEFDRNGLGLHVAESFASVIDVNRCHLQADIANEIRNAVRNFAKLQGLSFFDLKQQQGFLRNLMIRTSAAGEILVLLSVTENNEKEISALMHFLQEKFPAINSLQYVINPKRNDTIYDLEPITFYGKNYIIEKLGKYSFKIGPKSFFQTNTAQAIKLYDITKDFAGLSGEENVYDLYTGVGSIGIYLSEACKSITGIEQIEEAIKDARENASLNNVSNCTFYAGDVRMILNEDFIEKHGKADVIVTDPPRSGMHEDVVKTLLEHQSKAIVYVSCNAATQARDIAMLSEKYEVEKMRAVDMFPQTTHIENVAKLVLRR